MTNDFSEYDNPLVVKIGGSLMGRLRERNADNIYRIIKDISGLKFPSILVHGGGNFVTDAMNERGLKTEFLEALDNTKSRRMDSPDIIKIYSETMEEITRWIVSLCEECSVKAYGFYGAGTPIRGSRKESLTVWYSDPKRGRIQRIVHGQFYGAIKSVDTESVRRILYKSMTPVIPSLAISDKGELLNVDGDRTAAYVAGHLRCEKMVDLTDIDGLMLNRELVREVKYGQLDALTKRKDVGTGLRRKLRAARQALGMGLDEIILANGLREHPILSALSHENCTLIRK